MERSRSNVIDERGNIEIVRCLMEQVLGEGRLDLLPSIIAPDYEGHFAIGDHYGPEGLRIDIATYRNAFPDLSVTLDDLLAVDDKVVRRFTLRGSHQLPYLGIRPSGRKAVLRGLGIDRISGRQLIESWVHIDPPR